MSNNENPAPGTPALPPANPPMAPLSPTLAEREERERVYHAQIKAALEHNKAALFAALAANGITAVTVAFDGYGDSGQVESIEAKQGDAAVALPDARLELWQAGWETVGIEPRACPLPEAVEEICYALLTQTHCGWENNEGAYGDFTFDVAARTITLDYNERFTSSENYTHEF